MATFQQSDLANKFDGSTACTTWKEHVCQLNAYYKFFLSYTKCMHIVIVMASVACQSYVDRRLLSSALAHLHYLCLVMSNLLHR